MKTKLLLLSLLALISCNVLDPSKQNTASNLNSYANSQLFTLKGYQPIDPISIKYNNEEPDSLIYRFPNEATRVAIGKINTNGSLSFTTTTMTRKGESYTVIIDYIKYGTTSLPASYSYNVNYNNLDAKINEVFETNFGSITSSKEYSKKSISEYINISQNAVNQEIKIPIYVGVGLRIQANILILDDSLNINLGSLYNLGVAASQNKITGTLIIQTLGISGPQISSTLPIPDKVNESTIQNAITALATIKSKLYDTETNITAQVVGFGLAYNIDGAKDLIEATIHSRPPSVIKKLKNTLVFEEEKFQRKDDNVK